MRRIKQALKKFIKDNLKIEGIWSFDAENLEYFLLGDLNVDFISTVVSPIKNKLR